MSKHGPHRPSERTLFLIGEPSAEVTHCQLHFLFDIFDSEALSVLFCFKQCRWNICKGHATTKRHRSTKKNSILERHKSVFGRHPNFTIEISGKGYRVFSPVVALSLQPYARKFPSWSLLSPTLGHNGGRSAQKTRVMQFPSLPLTGVWGQRIIFMSSVLSERVVLSYFCSLGMGAP